MPRRHPARIGRALARTPGRTELLRCVAAYNGDTLVATPLTNQASGAVTSMAHANALAVVPQERGDLREGDPVELLWLHELGL
jgi:molybdopterin molybdotransferase